MSRKPLGTKTRFEVFKRDSFTCQYCGAKAPEVLLEVDHVQPVVAGGDNDLLNLVTSCVNCNSGKGPRLLSDDSVAEKRRKQVEELQGKREQISMILEWHRGLAAVKSAEVYAALEYLSDMLSSFGIPLDERIEDRVQQIVRSVGLQEFLHSCDIAFAQYYDAHEALQKLGGIAENRKRRKTDPDAEGTAYVFGIARRRFGAFQSWQLKSSIRVLRAAGVDWPWIRENVGRCNSLHEWREFSEAHIAKLGMKTGGVA